MCTFCQILGSASMATVMEVTDGSKLIVTYGTASNPYVYRWNNKEN